MKIIPDRFWPGVTDTLRAVDDRQPESNDPMSNYCCKYCGYKSNSVSSHTNNHCHRHPEGASKGKHALYEGDEKSQFTCQNCGYKAPSISSLTSNWCNKHPDGVNKGKHQPAL